MTKLAGLSFGSHIQSSPPPFIPVFGTTHAYYATRLSPWAWGREGLDTVHIVCPLISYSFFNQSLMHQQGLDAEIEQLVNTSEGPEVPSAIKMVTL